METCIARELGRIERTFFTLEWVQNTEFRWRVLIGLNKGEAKNALARSVFSLTASVKCEIEPLRISGIAPADSTW